MYCEFKFFTKRRRYGGTIRRYMAYPDAVGYARRALRYFPESVRVKAAYKNTEDNITIRFTITK